VKKHSQKLMHLPKRGKTILLTFYRHTKKTNNISNQKHTFCNPMCNKCITYTFNWKIYKSEKGVRDDAFFCEYRKISL